jgi:peptide/nickel transport system permease protein
MPHTQGYWHGVWRHFKRNRLAVAGLWVSIGLVTIALLADFIANDQPYYMVYQGKTYFPIVHSYLDHLGLWPLPEELRRVDFATLTPEQAIFPPVPHRPNRIDLLVPLEEPSPAHWLGTDALGRDVLSGIIHGSRISLSIGFISIGIAMSIGLVLGAIAGYFGGWVDLVISRLFELMLGIPTLFLIITIAATLTPNIFYTMMVIGLTSWVGIARLTRNEFLRVRNYDYVTAAVALGTPTPRVLIRHILPNALAPVLVSVVLGIAAAILTESGLSFLGIGVPPDLVTWGSLINEARSNTFAWWLAVFPGTAILLAVVAYYLVGEGLRDALDPRLN